MRIQKQRLLVVSDGNGVAGQELTSESRAFHDILSLARKRSKLNQPAGWRDDVQGGEEYENAGTRSRP